MSNKGERKGTENVVNIHRKFNYKNNKMKAKDTEERKERPPFHYGATCLFW
jgi:hypothetical protein